MATSKRGFASMDASKQREIASKGGRAAHAKGTAHEFTSDEARVAGVVTVSMNVFVEGPPSKAVTVTV